jgi:multiple antibiotic resistance protein
MDALTESLIIFYILLNPFIMSVYLIAHVRTLSLSRFAAQLGIAAAISFVVFVGFVLGGDAVFDNVLQIRFAAFQIFGGITFLIIGIRLILGVSPAIDVLPPNTESLSGSIAMPYIVGPGTISASIIAGNRLSVSTAVFAIGVALGLAMLSMLLIKVLHDFVRTRNEKWVHRYVEIAGRVTALFTGSFAIEMIINGFTGVYSQLR